VALLKHWRQTTQLSAPEDWMFASMYKSGRQPLRYTYVWNNLGCAALKAGIGDVSSHTFRHTSRMWLDSVGTPVGGQQKLMRHADIRTTMNIYGRRGFGGFAKRPRKSGASSNSTGLTGCGTEQRQVYENMGWETGLEPATAGATDRSSTD